MFLCDMSTLDSVVVVLMRLGEQKKAYYTVASEPVRKYIVYIYLHLCRQFIVHTLLLPAD